MSIKAMSYVWETKLKPTQKLLLMAIADRCNDMGECYPGVDDFPQKVGVSKRRVQQIFTELEEIGEIRIELGAGIKTPSGSTNRYYMTKYRKSVGIKDKERPTRADQVGQGVKQVSPLEEQGVKSTSSHGVKQVSSHGVKPISPKPSVEPSVEPSDSVASDGESGTSSDDTKPERKPNPMYDAIHDIWGYSGALNGGMAKMLQGIATHKGFAPYNLREEITPDQLRQWAKWYRRTVLGNNPALNMLEDRAKIQSSIHLWLDTGENRADSDAATGPLEPDEYPWGKYVPPDPRDILVPDPDWKRDTSEDRAS